MTTMAFIAAPFTAGGSCISSDADAGILSIEKLDVAEKIVSLARPSASLVDTIRSESVPRENNPYPQE